jgi:ribokinase
VCQLEIRQETVKRAFELARAAGVQTVLNPAPAAQLLPGFLELTDLIVPNETELQLLTGQPVRALEEVKAAAHTLLGRGAKGVIVTLGERGALHVTPEAALHHPPHSVKAFDSTGAGDAFIGALVASMIEGDDMAQAIAFANKAAALSVTRAGTQTSFTTRDELLKFGSALEPIAV